MMVFYIIVGSQNIPVPQRPSSSQSDGPPRMSQSPMPGKRYTMKSKLFNNNFWGTVRLDEYELIDS